jgi:murein tripeptide amidase MpaA
MLIVVFVGGTHAREWISPSSATYLCWFLTSDNEDAIKLRSLFTFTVIPVLNVDGYEYTRSTKKARMWRKNREPNRGSSCIGTDINRNYETKFGGKGTSANPCSDIYRGVYEYSTTESSTLTNLLKSLNNVVSFTGM